MELCPPVSPLLGTIIANDAAIYYISMDLVKVKNYNTIN